jgi:hypothetical protein
MVAEYCAGASPHACFAAYHVGIVKAIACWCLIVAAAAADTGTTTRPGPSDYDAHAKVAGAEIAASRMSAAEVTKLFSAAVARNFVVIEVAVFPEAGRTFDVQILDFDLKPGSGDRLYALTPEEVAWHGKKQPNTSSAPRGLDPNIRVIGEAGIAVGSRTDPSTGRQVHGVGTYESVGVTNMPQPTAPRSQPSGTDTYAIEGKLRGWELQEGPAVRPISGYLYFPASKKDKNLPLTLEYSRSGERAVLGLPAR